MNVIGYIRVSTDTQAMEKQRHLLLEYAQRHQLHIAELINVEVSSRRDTKERRIDAHREGDAPGALEHAFRSDAAQGRLGM